MQNFWQILAKVYQGELALHWSASVYDSCGLVKVVTFRNYESHNLGATKVTRNFIMEWKKWYSVSKIVLTYCEKKKSSDQEKLLKFEAEGREFAKILRSLEQFIQTVKGKYNF